MAGGCVQEARCQCSYLPLSKHPSSALPMLSVLLSPARYPGWSHAIP